MRYVLEGSVRKVAGRVRITGQLIEAATNAHLWADKFDGELADVFDLQDQVTTSVVGLIAPKLEQAEMERAKQKATESLDSYDLYLRGMELTYKRSYPEARELFRNAFREDPEYAAAYAMAAWTFINQQATGGIPLDEDMTREAVRLANIASKLANEDAFTLARSGHVLAYLGHEYDRAASMVEEAVALNPNLAVAWYCRGFVSVSCGEGARAIESFDRVIRLSPVDPLRARAWNGISLAHLLLARHEEGCASAIRSIQLLPDAHNLATYIAHAVALGRTDEAHTAATQLLHLQPHFRASHAEKVFPIRLPEVRRRIAAALRGAGLED